MMKAGKKDIRNGSNGLSNRKFSFFNDIVLWFEDKINSVCCKCGKMNWEE